MTTETRTAVTALAAGAPAAARWVGVQEAATFLGLPVITLRRSLERAARRGEDGVTEARVDGLCARKFGRLWRVRFSGAWLAPATGARPR